MKMGKMIGFNRKITGGQIGEIMDMTPSKKYNLIYKDIDGIKKVMTLQCLSIKEMVE
jgi:hypothetical protein